MLGGCAKLWAMQQGKQRSALTVVFLTVFIDLVGFGIIIPLSPFLATRYGASAVDVGQLMAVYSLMQFIFSPVWGRISDRFGRRPVILISVLGAAIAHTGFAFAQSLWMLYVARIFAGICGANIATAMAYIADVTPRHERSKSMGLIGAAFGLGFILGPVLGGLGGIIGDRLGSTPPLGMSFGALIAGVLCLLNFLIAFKNLRESLPQEKRSVVKPRQSRLKLISSYLQRPTVNLLMIIYFLSIFAMANMEPMMFLYVKDKFGWGLKIASLGFAYVGFMMALTQGYLIRKVMPRFGERKLLLTGLVFAAVGLTSIGLAANVYQLGLAVTLLALGTGFINPSITGSVSLLTPEDEQGTVIGVNQSMASLGRILGPELSGHFYLGGASHPFYIAGIITSFGFLIGLSIFKKLPEHGKSAH